MRITSFIAAAAVVIGLAWWFGLRPMQEDASRFVAATSEGKASATTAEGLTETKTEPATVPQTEATQRASNADLAVPVLVVQSTEAPAKETKRLRGRTEANRTVTVEAETSGLVITQPLRAGTRVSAGDVLCRLDPGPREAELAEARARLAEAESEAVAARGLSEKGFTAETTRLKREATLQAAEAQLRLVQIDIERLTMRAPFDGVLESDGAELGARLGIGDDCATVIDLSTVKVIAFVSERDVDRITPGQPVDVALVTGEERKGTIRFIGRMADETTRTYKVEAVLENTDGRLRDGMTAEIRMTLDAGDAHRLPLSALTLDSIGRLGVRIVEEGRARFVPVRVLRDSADGAFVVGLPDQATVIVVGQEFVSDGRKVEAVPYDDAEAWSADAAGQETRG